MILDLSKEAGAMQSTALVWWCESYQPQCEPLLCLAELLLLAGPAMGWFVAGHEERPATGWVEAGSVWAGVFQNDLSSSLRSCMVSLTFASLACWSTSAFSRSLTLFHVALISSTSLRAPSSMPSKCSLC